MNFTYNQKTKNTKRENPYYTSLYKHDFENADDEDWMRYSALLDTVNFDEEMDKHDVESSNFLMGNTLPF